MSAGDELLADTLGAIARELLELDATLSANFIAALTEGNQRHPTPYLGSILLRANSFWTQCACGEETGDDELFTLNEETWALAYPNGTPGSNPCLSCLEDALGRDLVPTDFEDDEVNGTDRLRSPRLRQRMGLLD